RVRAIRQENGGVAAARNNGVRMSTGHLLAFIDADDIWLPDKLRCQVERFIAEPDLGLVHCGGEDVDADGTVLRRHLEGLQGWVAEDLLMLRREVIFGPGSSAMVPRAVFDAVGGFDPRIPPCEDGDLC